MSCLSVWLALSGRTGFSWRLCMPVDMDWILELVLARTAVDDIDVELRIRWRTFT